ncbi:MAG: SGNH/GDSL hydrolase family protein, partial [Lachnospiraceae bacterium]|nr:SGNH/GDSL hydrolase family protein [Lachnospiraceae bacterium]
MDKKRFIKWFAVFSSVMLVAVAAVVAVVDPFFHYHKPLNGLKAVVVTPEYQCIGTVRNFDYDSIILGSSVAEN